jgi:hypothetical protein
MPVGDQRRKHSNCPNKIPAELLGSFHWHIAETSQYQSCYVRNQNPNKVRLFWDLTVVSYGGAKC